MTEITSLELKFRRYLKKYYPEKYKELISSETLENISPIIIPT